MFLKVVLMGTLVIWVGSASNSSTAQDEINMKEYAELEQIFLHLFSATHERRIFEDLEILDRQVDDINRLAKEHREKGLRMARDRDKLELENQKIQDQTERLNHRRQVIMPKFYGNQQKLFAETLKKVEDILLEHQFKRLMQIGVQKRLAMVHLGDPFGVFIELAKTLELSKTEKEEFLQTVTQMKQELESEREKLYRQTQEDIIRSLPPEARKKAKELIGNIYID